MKKLLFTILSLLPLLTANAQIPADTRQVIVGIAPSWNSSHVTLSVFERANGASRWQINGQGWKGRLGRKGLAWGLGIHNAETIQTSSSKLFKKEGDGRAPAGIFRIGGAYGYAPSSAIQKKPTLPYRQITTRDLWVEDSTSPSYNRHLILKHQPKSAWEKKAQMRQGDYAHALKLFIGHNAPTAQRNAKPNAGSSIFFHIWRGGGSKPTAGCTTMDPTKLKSLISKIDPAKKPVYVLLTQAEYQRLRAVWNLP